MNRDRILVAGARGLLGQKIVEVFERESEYELIRCGIEEEGEDFLTLDITDREKVVDTVSTYKPSIIINAAAFTDVDGAERQKEIAYKINATAVGYLAEAANIFGCKLVHVSTDYVFNGLKGSYSEESVPEPVNYYGRTKLAGENLVISKVGDFAILRTQVLYGYASNVKKNFVLWVIDKLSKSEEISVVTDQVGNPTLADELAFAILKVCQKNARGLYHVSGFETVSRFEFAREIASVFNLDFELVKPIKTHDLTQLARRPLNSSFVCLKAQTDLGIGMPSIKDSLLLMKQQMKRAGIIEKTFKN
ncbi:MAG TPA: dTDP-4-dehydrorhamnose reductase [Candidatus Kryptonia bacterium]